MANMPSPHDLILSILRRSNGICAPPQIRCLGSRRKGPRRRTAPAHDNPAPGVQRWPDSWGKEWLNHPEFDRDHQSMDYCLQTTRSWAKAGPRRRHFSGQQSPAVRRFPPNKTERKQRRRCRCMPENRLTTIEAVEMAFPLQPGCAERASPVSSSPKCGCTQAVQGGRVRNMVRRMPGFYTPVKATRFGDPTTENHAAHFLDRGGCGGSGEEDEHLTVWPRATVTTQGKHGSTVTVPAVSVRSTAAWRWGGDKGIDGWSPLVSQSVGAWAGGASYWAAGREIGPARLDFLSSLFFWISFGNFKPDIWTQIWFADFSHIILHN
jgi:hypothetical protein